MKRNNDVRIKVDNWREDASGRKFGIATITWRVWIESTRSGDWIMCAYNFPTRAAAEVYAKQLRRALWGKPSAPQCVHFNTSPRLDGAWIEPRKPAKGKL